MVYPGMRQPNASRSRSAAPWLISSSGTNAIDTREAEGFHADDAEADPLPRRPYRHLPSSEVPSLVAQANHVPKLWIGFGVYGSFLFSHRDPFQYQALLLIEQHVDEPRPQTTAMWYPGDNKPRVEGFPHRRLRASEP